jgi:enoyl-CoA hydratase/carnithine racemase
VGGPQLRTSSEATTDVIVERDGPVGVVTMNRPQALNALSLARVKSVAEALRRGRR